MAKIKLVFFDMEGVIFDTGVKEFGKNTAASLWTILVKALGPAAVEDDQRGKDIWNDGKFKNYMEWVEYAARAHQKHGLNMDLFYQVIHSVPYMKGALEVFEELRKRGIKTVIISGGFKNQANRAIRDLKIDHVFAACEYFFDENSGLLSHWNIIPCDYEGKVDFMGLMMREYKLKPEECAFVGDGVNDKFLAKEVGLSIAFNGRKELQDVCTHSINQPEDQKDLREILKFL